MYLHGGWRLDGATHNGFGKLFERHRGQIPIVAATAAGKFKLSSICAVAAVPLKRALGTRWVHVKTKLGEGSSKTCKTYAASSSAVEHAKRFKGKGRENVEGGKERGHARVEDMSAYEVAMRMMLWCA